MVCEVENMLGLVRERMVMDRAQVTPQPLVSGAGGGWRPRPGQSALMAAAGAFLGNSRFDSIYRAFARCWGPPTFTVNLFKPP